MSDANFDADLDREAREYNLVGESRKQILIGEERLQKEICTACRKCWACGIANGELVRRWGNSD